MQKCWRKVEEEESEFELLMCVIYPRVYYVFKLVSLLFVRLDNNAAGAVDYATTTLLHPPFR